VTELFSQRLRMRRATLDDLPVFREVLTDPAAMRFWSTPPHTDEAQTRAWVEATVAAGPPDADDFVLELGGQAIGKAGCWRLPEIGYILHPRWWGQGLAREALETIIPHLFRTYEMPELVAEVDPRNAASIGLLQRLGFHETGRAAGTITVGDELCDSVYFALRRPVGD
jgi:RimJ/RimL family protein N-acetyltransferase